MVTKAERIQARAEQNALDGQAVDLLHGCDDASALEALPDDEAWRLATAPDAAQPQPSELLPGMVLLKAFLTPREQQQLVNDAQSLGLSGKGGFYVPTYASGARCRLHQMCVGRHWNVKTEQYEQIRTNVDNAPVLPLPELWKQIAMRSLDAAIQIDSRVMGTCPQRMQPDVCVVNYYKKAGRNGMHIDKDESPEAMEMGSPVISFSIGAAAEFAYVDHYPDAAEGVPIVRLESGDVLVFGGPSRKVVHALTRVYAHTEPKWLRMRQGRLNLTFREYQPPTV